MSTALYTCAPADLASLLSCPDSCPACPLRGCNSLASCSRNSSLLPARFFPAQVDFPERCEGSGYAVQFILKSRAFLLEFADHRLHQAFWHAGILSSASGRQGSSHGSSIAASLGATLTGVIHLGGMYLSGKIRLHPPPPNLDRDGTQGPGHARELLRSVVLYCKSSPPEHFRSEWQGVRRLCDTTPRKWCDLINDRRQSYNSETGR